MKYKNNSTESKSKRWIIPLAAVVLLVVGGILTFHFYRNAQNEDGLSVERIFESGYANETQEAFMNHTTVELLTLDKDTSKATAKITLPDLTKGPDLDLNTVETKTITTEAAITEVNGEWVISQDEFLRIIEQELEQQFSEVIANSMEVDSGENG